MENNPETIQPDTCYVNTVQWEFDKELLSLTMFLLTVQ